jgi:hypothetical protein
MKQEDKKLLLKGLCTMLPYKIIVKVNDTQGIMDEIDIPNERIFVSNLNPFLYGGARASWFTVNGDEIYPYLRPMSSMTKEEKKELQEIAVALSYNKDDIMIGTQINSFRQLDGVLDLFNSHHLDWRGLTEKGLALEAPEGMYNLDK